MLRSHVRQLLASHAFVACRVVHLVNAIHIIFLQVSQTVGARLGHAQARLIAYAGTTDTNDNDMKALIFHAIDWHQPAERDTRRAVPMCWFV